MIKAKLVIESEQPPEPPVLRHLQEFQDFGPSGPGNTTKTNTVVKGITSEEQRHACRSTFSELDSRAIHKVYAQCKYVHATTHSSCNCGDRRC